ncbi:MAG: hypothetical protein RLZZ58_1861 [Pseudomonadota bacterium]
MAGTFFLAALMSAGAPAAPAAVDAPAPRVQTTATARARIVNPVTLRRTGDRLIISAPGTAPLPATHRAPRADRIDAVDFF